MTTTHTPRILLPGEPLVQGDTALRPWRDADLPELVQACRDPEIVRWTSVPAAYTEDPQPVVTPHATSAAITNGRSSSIGTHEFSGITIHCENVPSTHIPPTSSPFS